MITFIIIIIVIVLFFFGGGVQVRYQHAGKRGPGFPRLLKLSKRGSLQFSGVYRV